MRIWRDPKAHGRGTRIELDGNELAHAIDAYLYAIGVMVTGPRTTTVMTKGGDPGLCGGAGVYVDPSGRVLRDGDEVK